MAGNEAIHRITDTSENIRAYMTDPQIAFSTNADATRHVKVGSVMHRLDDEFYIGVVSSKINATTGTAVLQTIKAADGVAEDDVATVGQVGSAYGSVGNNRLNASTTGGKWQDTSCSLDTDGSNNTVFTADTGDSIIHEGSSLFQVIDANGQTGGAFVVSENSIAGDEWLKIQPTAANKMTLPNLTVSDISSDKSMVTKEYVDGKVISAQITTPTLAALQALVDSGVTVFYAGSDGGVCELPSGTLNLKNTNYTFHAGRDTYNIGAGDVNTPLKIRDSLTLSFPITTTGPHFVRFTGAVMFESFGGLTIENQVAPVEVEILDCTSGGEYTVDGDFIIETVRLNNVGNKLIMATGSTLKYQYLSTVGGIIQGSGGEDSTQELQEDWLRPRDVKGGATATLNPMSDLQALIDDGYYHFIVHRDYSLPSGAYTFKKTATGDGIQYLFSGGELRIASSATTTFSMESAAGISSGLVFDCDVSVGSDATWVIDSAFFRTDFHGNLKCDYNGGVNTVETLTFPTTVRFGRFEVPNSSGGDTNSAIVTNGITSVEEWAFDIGGDSSATVNGSGVLSKSAFQSFYRTSQQSFLTQDWTALTLTSGLTGTLEYSITANTVHVRGSVGVDTWDTQSKRTICDTLPSSINPGGTEQYFYPVWGAFIPDGGGGGNPAMSSFNYGVQVMWTNDIILYTSEPTPAAVVDNIKVDFSYRLP
jgi:hypothetical protein